MFKKREKYKTYGNNRLHDVLDIEIMKQLQSKNMIKNIKTTGKYTKY